MYFEVAAQKIVRFGSKNDGSNMFVGQFSNVQYRAGYVLDLEDSEMNYLTEAWAPLFYAQETIDTERMFKDDFYTVSDRRRLAIYRENAMGQSSHYRIPHFFGNTLDLRGHHKSLMIDHEIGNTRVPMGSSNTAITIYVDLQIEDAFPLLSSSDLAELIASYPLTNIAESTFVLYNFGAIRSVSNSIYMRTISFDDMSTGTSSKKVEITVVQNNYIQFTCSPTSLVLFFSNSASIIQKLRFVYHMQKIDIYSKGQINIKIIQDVATNNFQLVMECNGELTTAQATDLLYNIDFASLGTYYATSENTPNIEKPGIFRVILKEAVSVVGGVPRLNSPADCLNMVDHKSTLFFGSTNTDYRAYGCNDANILSAFGRCQPKATSPVGCLAYWSNMAGSCAKCKPGFINTTLVNCVQLTNNCLRNSKQFSTSCTRCQDGYVLSGSSNTTIGCIQFTPVTYPNQFYVPFLQTVAPLTHPYTGPNQMQQVGNKYSLSFTIDLNADESSVFMNAQVQFVQTSGIADLYSHFDVYLYEDGTPIQTRGVPYTVTSFASKILTFDVVRHHVMKGPHTYKFESMYPARVTVWQIGVKGYDPTEECWFRLNPGQCLICNKLIPLISNYGRCIPMPEGYNAMDMIGGDVMENYSPCFPNIKYCYKGKILQCNNGFYPDSTLTTCRPCDPDCLTCLGIPTNCTSCPTGSSLSASPTNTNAAQCLPCPPYCSQCAPWTQVCTQCSAGYSLDSTGGCCPVGLSLNIAKTQCVSCAIQGCDRCDTDNHCALCLPGLNMLSTGACGNDSKERVTISGAFDSTASTVDYFFSRELDLHLVDHMYTLTYDREGFQIDFTCFGGSIVVPGDSRKSCRNRVSFFDGIEVYNQQVVLDISKDVLLSDTLYLPAQTIKLDNRIRWYDLKDSTARTSTLGAVTSVAVKSGMGLAFLTVSSVCISFLKLTQHIEMIVYMNVFFPNNLKTFLDYFGEDIIDSIVNPFDYMARSNNCVPPRTFSLRGLQCAYLNSAGQTFFILLLAFLLCILTSQLKDKHRLLANLNNYFSRSWVVSLMDGMYINMCLGAMLNLQAGLADGSAWAVINFLLSIVCVFVLVAETALGFFYCLESPFMQRESAKLVHSNEDKHQPVPEVEKKPDKGEEEHSPLHRADSPPKITKLVGWRSKMQRIKQWVLKQDLNHFYGNNHRDVWSGKLAIPIEQVVLFASAVCLVFLHEHPFAQILSCAMLQLGETVMVMFSPMYRLPSHNAKKNIISTILTITLSLMLSLTEQGNGVFTPRGQYNVVGFGTLLLLSILLFVALVSTLFDIYHFCKDCYKGCKNANKVHFDSNHAKNQKDLSSSRIMTKQPTISSSQLTPVKISSELRITPNLASSPLNGKVSTPNHQRPISHLRRKFVKQDTISP